MRLAISGIDLAIVIGYLIAVIAMGIWIGRRQRELGDYLLGSRNLPWWLLLLSIVSTETSSVTFLSLPGRAYSSDLSFLQLPLGYIIGRYIVAAVLLPLFFRGELFSAYEVLQKRFGGTTKRIASLLFMVTRSIGDGIRLYLAALMLRAVMFQGTASDNNAASGLTQELAISILVMGIAMIIFTYFGGLTAVVWTDFAQFLLYVVAALAAAAVLIAHLPTDWTTFWETTRAAGKWQIFDPSFDFTKTETLWAGLIGGAFVSLASHGADQSMVQRYLAARSETDAARALRLSGWIVLVQFAIFLAIGVGLWSFYAGREFPTRDAVFIEFIVNELPVGIVGLAIAGVLAAAMSSSLNVLAGAATTDFLAPWWGEKATPKRLLRATHVGTLIFGVIQIAVAMGGAYLNADVIDSVMSIATFTIGIVLGLFWLGVFTKHVTQPAALVGLCGGISLMSYIAFNTKLAWPWYAVVGSLTTFAIGVAAQFVIERVAKILGRGQ